MKRPTGTIRTFFTTSTMLLLVTAALACGPAAAQGSSVSAADSDRQRRELLASERFRHLAAELRCLVCQNQTLADSNAELAVDLRDEVLRQMAAGKSDTEIKQHLVARFGEFVLYRPALSARNLALWIGPFLLLAIGALAIWRMTRRRARPISADPAGDDELLRVERMLSDQSTRR